MLQYMLSFFELSFTLSLGIIFLFFTIFLVSEDEITLGIFNCPKNTNTSCVWFRRTFTDLYDHKPSIDSSLANYSDVTVGRRGLEFDSETIKLLNYLKEAKLPAKYIGYESTVEEYC